VTDAPTPTAKVGNLTRGPELRFSAAGKPWATFGLAVERPVTPGDWKGEKVTDFYEVTTFGVDPDLRFATVEIQRTEHREPAPVGQDAEPF
jgi:hypothetical protein